MTAAAELQREFCMKKSRAFKNGVCVLEALHEPPCETLSGQKFNFHITEHPLVRLKRLGRDVNESQLKVLTGLAEGLKRDDIARLLGCTLRMVHFHTNALFKHFGATNVQALIVIALQDGALELKELRPRRRWK
jgi:DNA-binding NarL/FixJ family response regulator